MLLGSQVEYGHKSFSKVDEDKLYSMQDLKDCMDYYTALHGMKG